MRITEQGIKKLEVRVSNLKPKISKELEAEINRSFLDLAEYIFKDILCGRKTMSDIDQGLQRDYVCMFKAYVKEGSNRLIAEDMRKYLRNYTL
jgi:hypothetical protein